MFDNNSKRETASYNCNFMPPKKQEEEPSAPIITWNILPIVFNSPLAAEALKKAVTIKKVVDQDRLIELLKDKGIDKYLTEGKLSREGELFIFQNMNSVGQEYLAQSRKPADPKKDQKKDSKKDSKKEEVVVEEGDKPIQFDFAKGITQFLFYTDVPLDSETLGVALKNGLVPDVIIWVEEEVKEGSQKPNYDLLSNTRGIDDFMNEMNSVSPDNKQLERRSEDVCRERQIKKEVIRAIQSSRMSKESKLENTLIIEVPFQKNLQHPESDCEAFLSTLFKRLCELSVKKEQFQSWAKEQKLITMVPTIKQTIKKEVVVEQKKDEKKGGKKDPAAQPVTQIVEEVVERKYESFPQNIKSDLQLYNRISSQRKKEPNTSIYWKIVDDIACSISSSTEPHKTMPTFKEKARNLWKNEKNKPLNKVSVQNLQNKLPQIKSSQTSDQLTNGIKLKSHKIQADVTLLDIKKKCPSDISLQFEYKLQQFTQLGNQLGDRICYEFDDRKYVEKLSEKDLNSRVNQYLEHNPKIYYGSCENDGYNLMILARTNPPGRILYQNNVFDWRVMPNFQFWEKYFNDKKQSAQFWDYGWKQAGNLKILSKKMMPTDNSVLSESVYCLGDNERRMISLSKQKVEYGLHQIDQGNHLLFKHCHDMKTMVYTKNNEENEKVEVKSAEIQICLQRRQFTVLFNPFPTIVWHQHQLELSRSFGAKGELTKKMKDGSIEILYPNGNVSMLKFGVWSHIKNNKFSTESSQQQTDLKVQTKNETDKKIQMRQDSTSFITYSNGQQAIIFKDGTMIRKVAKNKLQIKNPCNIVIRIRLPRERDFNVIGSGSAFAYLGHRDLLQRSYDGSLYELYHPTFTWHSYTEGIDRSGNISQEQVMLIAYPDQSIMKIGDNGLITFLDKIKDHSQGEVPERWIQLFTSPEYHQEGVYDVDLIQGEIRTKDAESNFFKLRIDGTGKSEIAVSFNIGNQKEQKNSFGEGFHVPEQNYFLPPPQNSIIPLLFLIYPDGSGQEYLSQSQLEELNSWRAVTSQAEGRNICQYSRLIKPESQYICHSFSQKVDVSVFTLPNCLQEAAVRPSNVCYQYNNIEFRSIETIEWDTGFQKVREQKAQISKNRQALKDELQSLRRKVK